jgi:hypothetical protein
MYKSILDTVGRNKLGIAIAVFKIDAVKQLKIYSLVNRDGAIWELVLG